MRSCIRYLVEMAAVLQVRGLLQSLVDIELMNACLQLPFVCLHLTSVLWEGESKCEQEGLGQREPGENRAF